MPKRKSASVEEQVRPEVDVVRERERKEAAAREREAAKAARPKVAPKVTTEESK